MPILYEKTDRCSEQIIQHCSIGSTLGSNEILQVQALSNNTLSILYKIWT